MRPAIAHILILSLGFALGFAYARGASVAPIMIERCADIDI